MTIHNIETARWAGLTGRIQGDGDSHLRPLVLLHGLTFNHRMWEPVMELLPSGMRVLALDLPGHGGSRAASGPGLHPVVEALHEAVMEAGLERPVIAGHSIGGPLAMIYAAAHPAAAMVSIDAPIRFEPFADQIRQLKPLLTGPEFDATWARYQASWGMERVPAPFRLLLEPGRHGSQEIVLTYQADLLDGSLDEILRRRAEGFERLRAAATPCMYIQSAAIDPQERAWLAEQLPQAEVLVWPVGHHFPQLERPAALAELLIESAS